MRFAALIFLIPASALAYNSCTDSAGRTRWTDDKCFSSERQVTYGRDGKPVQDTRKPSIGMSADEARVLAWPWGAPTDVNRTTTAKHIREQWIYPGHRYLYFTDDVLTTIQE